MAGTTVSAAVQYDTLVYSRLGGKLHLSLPVEVAAKNYSTSICRVPPKPLTSATSEIFESAPERLTTLERNSI